MHRLERLIEQCLPALAGPGDVPPEYLPPGTPVTPGEAEGFFRAIDAGLFELGDDGVCRPLGLRPSTGYFYELLYKPRNAENKVRLWREWLTHAAIPAMLHLDFGYPLHDMALDVDAFDVLVYSPLNQPFIAVEAKKTSAELERLLNEMHALERQPFALSYPARLSNSAQKFRSLLALRPVYFLAVAPDMTRAHEVRYPLDRTIPTAELTAIERIPTSQG